MALKFSVLFSLALIFVGSNGFSVDRKIPQEVSLENIGLMQDYGGLIADAILNIIGTLDDRIPLPETLVPAHIPINLTELALNISSSLNISLPLRGELNLRNVAIAGLSSTRVPVSVLNVNGILATIPLNLRVTNPELRIEAEYDIKASLANIIPVRGQGIASIILNLTAGLDVEIKAKIGSPMVMEMPLFDYILEDLKHLKVDIDGLLENEQLSTEIGKILTVFVDEYITPKIVETAEQIHANLVTIPPIIFNSLKLTFAQFLDLINQIIGAIGSGDFFQ